MSYYDSGGVDIFQLFHNPGGRESWLIDQCTAAQWGLVRFAGECLTRLRVVNSGGRKNLARERLRQKREGSLGVSNVLFFLTPLDLHPIFTY